MGVARIIQVQGPRWIVINDKMYNLMSYGEPVKFKDNDYHMTFEAAKNSAYENGYRSYIYQDRQTKFRRNRDERIMKGCLL